MRQEFIVVVEVREDRILDEGVGSGDGNQQVDLGYVCRQSLWDFVEGVYEEGVKRESNTKLKRKFYGFWGFLLRWKISRGGISFILGLCCV